MIISIEQLGYLVNGKVEGDKNILLSGPSKIEDGKPGTITFLANPKYESHIYKTKASAVLVSNDFIPKEKLNVTLIRVDNVLASLQVLMQNFEVKPKMDVVDRNNISIHKSAKVGEGGHLGEFVVISENSKIGTNTIIYPQVFVGADVVIGDNCLIYPGVKIMSKTVIGDNCIIHANSVLGSDGFGFSKDKNGEYKKIPQLGNVVIEDNVEMGGSCVIDRATMGSTIIRRGVKLDNLVHIAHNVEIGENAAIAGQCGIAGSAYIGKGTMMGGQVGVAGHISIADGAQIQAKSGIAGAVKKKNAKLYGYPAIDYTDYLRSYAGFKQLPDLMKRIQDLEKILKK